MNGERGHDGQLSIGNFHNVADEICQELNDDSQIFFREAKGLIMSQMVLLNSLS